MMRHARSLQLALRTVPAFVALLLMTWPSSSAATGSNKSGKPSKNTVSEKIRSAAIRRSQIWSPTVVSSMNMRLGPQGRGAYPPGAMVACDYVEGSRSGHTPKFDCAVAPGDVVKVRYGEENGHVQGSVLATRLLWALGFGADRVYPVAVTCRGCSADPWNDRERTKKVHVFNPAVLERKPAGHVIRSSTHEGWSWPELESVSEAAGGAPKAQRDALTLLAVFMQHTDSKDEQQRLVCLPGGLAEDGTTCETPFMFIHDVGTTFGRANRFNRDAEGSVSFEDWARTPVWRDVQTCRAHLSRSSTGTLDDPRVSEAGREFLADLLVQITDAQLRDLFSVARVNLRSRKPGSDLRPAAVDEWMGVFKYKRQEIVNARCQP